jgi:hypothetical protein
MVIVEVPFNVFLDRNPHLKNRPLNEQFVHYNDYLMVNQMQMDYIAGKSDTIPSPLAPFSGYILQENGDYLLQEDESRIYI